MDVIEDDFDSFLFTENLKLVIIFLILVFFTLMMSHMMKEIELVVGGRDEEEMRTGLKEMMSMRSSRRHVLEDIEIKGDKIEEEARRVSICIPPKECSFVDAVHI
ncbi:Histone-lysine N-methyltransferase SETD1B [Forsythia ovata]|uniref:Histone-lysine N-methyltransferase SETD1B n=1 Tax=Forsythia ovata TaxID=205694 RepID=A0ABD1T8D5_9LAMI